MPIQLIRRGVLGSFAAVGVLTAAGMTPAQGAERGGRHRTGDPVSLTIMGTTDLHGCVFNWNYFQNAEYDDSARNDIGLAKVATLVEAVRVQRGRENTLMIVTTAPVVHNAQQEIRQLIIDWVTRARVVEPSSFASVDWTLVSGGAPVQISD
ncbi:hypothetical protein [Cryobacterium fucosi]|uniref:Bifunctional metallophosphatase/5'-nucleotidase n=1 Tax=Cryobacterium fucosi TaxID=1259157 RepID=A0A4R9B3B0_9MICO|nr:hypothetical protein [Cryobacterium fucosi]TFD74789.1 hypothetical protein E3T48_12785 [Cryobacterium fucosi]